MPSSLQSGFLFLINTVFNLYLFVLMIRVILVAVGANYFDPISQFVIRLTDWMVKPVRRFIPNRGRLEMASILLILIIELVKYFFIFLLMFTFPAILGLILMALGDIIKMLIDSFFYAILLQVILSWVQPYSPANRLLYQITSPIMRPIQRLIPPIAGVDISPIPAIIGLQFLSAIIAQPLITLGWQVAVG